MIPGDFLGRVEAGLYIIQLGLGMTAGWMIRSVIPDKEKPPMGEGNYRVVWCTSHGVGSTVDELEEALVEQGLWHCNARARTRNCKPVYALLSIANTYPKDENGHDLE